MNCVDLRETGEWLALVIASGVVGNFSSDLIKSCIKKMKTKLSLSEIRTSNTEKELQLLIEFMNICYLATTTE